MLARLKRLLFIPIFIFALASINQVKADDLSCLSKSQKQDFEQKLQELMVKSDNEIRNPSIGQKYIEIQNQKNQALFSLINCEGSIKSGEAQENNCSEEQKVFDAQVKAESVLDLEMNSQSDIIMNKVNNFLEKYKNLRSLYPSCK